VGFFIWIFERKMEQLGIETTIFLCENISHLSLDVFKLDPQIYIKKNWKLIARGNFIVA